MEQVWGLGEGFANTNNHRVVVFNQITEAFNQVSYPVYHSPYGLCLDKESSLLFVADYGEKRYKKLCVVTSRH